MLASATHEIHGAILHTAGFRVVLSRFGHANDDAQGLGEGLACCAELLLLVFGWMELGARAPIPLPPAVFMTAVFVDERLVRSVVDGTRAA